MIEKSEKLRLCPNYVRNASYAPKLRSNHALIDVYVDRSYSMRPLSFVFLAFSVVAYAEIIASSVPGR